MILTREIERLLV